MAARSNVRMLHATIEGMYVPKTDGGVYYVFPHGADQLVLICNDGDPDRIASMLNYAIVKGVEMELAQAGKKAKNSKNTVRPKARRTRLTLAEQADESAWEGVKKPKKSDCPVCGEAKELFRALRRGKPVYERRCRECNKAYSRGYSAGLVKSTGEATENDARRMATAKDRKAAVAEAWEYQVKSVRDRGLKLKCHPRDLPRSGRKVIGESKG